MNICAVADCDRPVKRNAYCYGHYMKNWRYGTPTPEWPARWVDIRGERFGTLTVVERVGQKWACRCDCGETRNVSAGDLNRTGEANTCGIPGQHLSDDIGYATAHERVRSIHGSASDHPCAACGRPALHWSYNHDDPDERHAVGLSPNPIAYSINPEHYSPRCVPCHKRYDLDRLNSTPLLSIVHG